jgi:hypothetical protein
MAMAIWPKKHGNSLVRYARSRLWKKGKGPEGQGQGGEIAWRWRIKRKKLIRIFCHFYLFYKNGSITVPQIPFNSFLFPSKESKIIRLVLNVLFTLKSESEAIKIGIYISIIWI